MWLPLQLECLQLWPLLSSSLFARTPLSSLFLSCTQDPNEFSAPRISFFRWKLVGEQALSLLTVSSLSSVLSWVLNSLLNMVGILEPILSPGLLFLVLFLLRVLS